MKTKFRKTENKIEYILYKKSQYFRILHPHKQISPKLLVTGGTWYQTLIVQFFEDQNHQTFGTNEVHSSKNSIQCIDIWN